MYYLYIKTHNITNLKYLGYTKSKNPYSYPGSGKYWTAHLKKHGYNFSTEILKECVSKEDVEYWGRYYSDLWDIVENKDWANLTEEKGSGGNLSNFWTDDSRDKNRSQREQWVNFIRGKTYSEIHGEVKGNIIRKKISSNSKDELIISDSEREKRSIRMREYNLSRSISEETIDKRVATFKKRGSNCGEKNGMTKKPNAKLVIGEKNSKTHVLQHIESGEKIVIKNLSKWARENNLNSSSVLAKFSLNLPINGWIRLESYKK